MCAERGLVICILVVYIYIYIYMYIYIYKCGMHKCLIYIYMIIYIYIYIYSYIFLKPSLLPARFKEHRGFMSAEWGSIVYVCFGERERLLYMYVSERVLCMYVSERDSENLLCMYVYIDIYRQSNDRHWTAITYHWRLYMHMRIRCISLLSWC